jgi:hypothetical protein
MHFEREVADPLSAVGTHRNECFAATCLRRSDFCNEDGAHEPFSLELRQTSDLPDDTRYGLATRARARSIKRSNERGRSAASAYTRPQSMLLRADEVIQ